MNFRIISIEQLEDYIHTTEFINSEVLPITIHRANSQIKNPRASKSDIALLIAYNDKKEIIAYTGALPDWLNGDSNNKFYWNSGWWANQNEGKKIALPLFLKLIDLCNKKMLFSNLTPLTKTILEQLGLFKVRTIKGIRGFLKSNLAEIIPGKVSSLSKFKFVFQIVDFTLNILLSIRLKLIKRKYSSSNFMYELINNADDELIHFIQTMNSNDLVQRSWKEFEWIKSFPWVFDSNKISDKEAKRYYFSYKTRIFKNYLIKITNENKIIAFLFLSNRDGHFKIPYSYFDIKYSKTVINIIYSILLKEKAISFTSFNSKILDAIKDSPSPFFFRWNTQRFFGMSKTISDEKINNDFFIQDGDGDVVFT